MSEFRVSARQDAADVIVSRGPDVCWTPIGDFWVPVPYSSIAYMDTAVRVSTTVRLNGNYDFQLNSRCATSTGHEPGTGKGVVRPGYLGPAHIETASYYSYSEGFATVAHRDPAWINREEVGPKEPEKTPTITNM
ncbi:DUF4150 domain-containing protein [Labrys sp. LIt4]|uniref:PAAR-like domain-containing protein n=1 Tax=Labrys sp. LIt4 TaxID=2821355 RepID=UPI001ADF8145|nr:DUF4150 domain-containing protein [Labrys sp. LIt4]